MVRASRLVRFLMIALTLQLGAGLAAGQDATPAATPSAAPNQGITLVASGLTNPRGLTWDPSGALYVASAGLGGPNAGVGETMGDMGNSNHGGPSAGIDKIVAGCPVPVASGLPSYLSGSARYRGVAASAFLDGDLYAFVEGGGPAKGNPDQPNGLYRIGADGAGTLIADLGKWLAANPVTHVPGDYDENGEPFAMLAATDGDSLIGVESNSGQVLRFTPDGAITRIVDVSSPHDVPTGLALDTRGNIYIGYLMSTPYFDGGSRVDRISPNGEISTVWTGLTMLTGVAIDADGVLYALEMSTGNTTTSPYVRENSGRLVKQTGPATSDVLLTGLPFPVGLAMGPDAGLYISFPATGPVGIAGTGAVLRFDAATPGPVSYDPAGLHAAPCGGAITLASPTAASAISVVATGLANPRGMVWDGAGALYVAQSGTGETATSVGPAASVVRIDGGCPVEVASGLPSSFDPFKDVLGPEDVTILDGRLYVLQGATGAFDEMNPATPNGVYRVDPDGELTLIADLTTWLRADPVARPPGDRNPLGEPFRILPGDGYFWVVDSNSGEVLRVTLTGGVERLADTSAVHHVVTAMTLAPGGGLYLGFLTSSPHEDATSKVVRITADGAMSDIWTGLTTVTGIVVAADGSLYASEMATGNETTAGMRPGTGRIVLQNGPASLTEIVTGLDFPIDLDRGPDGMLYVSGPAYGGDDRGGWILRIDPAAAHGQPVPAGLIGRGFCAGKDATPVAAASPIDAPPLPVVTPDAGTLAIPTAPPETPEPAASPAAANGTGATVQIQDFKFIPPVIQIKPGETVTWSNFDSVPHTATATGDAFNSGNLNPGQHYSFTFTDAGAFDYVCSYHAGMTGEIVVAP